MTQLERLELVLRRVHGSLTKTSRFAVSDEMFVLQAIINELAIANKVHREGDTQHDGI